MKRNKLAAIFSQQINSMQALDAEKPQMSSGPTVEVQTSKAKAHLHTMYMRTRNMGNSQAQLLTQNHSQPHYQNADQLIYRTSEDMKMLTAGS